MNPDTIILSLVVIFLSLLTRTIDGIVYDGEIKEKEAANKQYEKAKSKGQSAGRVQQE